MKSKDGTGSWLVYALVRCVLVVLRCFPVNWNLRTARAFANIWWFMIPRHRNRAIGHVRLAFGNKYSDKEVEQIAKSSLKQLAMFAIDFVTVPHLINEYNWKRYVHLNNMDSALRVLLEEKGAMLLTGHFGNWELAGYLLAMFGFDITAIMRPLDNVYLNQYVVKMRQKKGLELVDKKGATQFAEQVLRRGGSLGFIADQNAGSKGQFVDFFDVPASAYKSIGLLAMIHDVPIIVGYATRVGHAFKFEVGVERIIMPSEWKSQKKPLPWITQEYTRAIESAIRRAPDQYLWIHRRWKSRPRKEVNPPPLPA
ncbi:MAG TPA: lysophospholipid acyltransferase family protein [Phycisphaerae bacterium]|nr:lysophospholipid acyltransferase family protein [Phycisphaerales bacterium]HNO76741.1 lysophospholipid acyltransferase family protein [Phycisphaerae bacterium]